MKTLEDFYEHNKYSLKDIYTYEDIDGSLTHIGWEKDEILYNITAPHSENHFKFMIRINPKKTFDKWGNADIEEFFDTIDELVAYINDEEEIL